MKKNVTKIISTGLILSLLLSVMVLFTACGEPANLEEYIASNDSAKESIESLSSSSEDGGMSVDIKENTVTYTYKYTTTYDSAVVEQMKPVLESTMDNASSTFTNVADTLEEESGIKGVIIKVVYLNGDGSEIYSAQY